ncbi:hypothetical protein TNIN_173751 [Trichonephila inaurata madagascariensis]|uniref:Uncharacterized protein n=1 Tax=Trichonephila inaurata madagascariensis TaxID=2747483 RepID=A0A8X7CS89_9ARAC|nr:hypothetical protein TNIN_173751 [Trichonephila inaurata madagascariensis]
MSSETFDRGSEDSSHVCFHAIPYSLLRNGEPLSLIKHGAMVPSSHQKHEHGMATPFIPTAEEGSLVESPRVTSLRRGLETPGLSDQGVSEILRDGPQKRNLSLQPRKVVSIRIIQVSYRSFFTEFFAICWEYFKYWKMVSMTFGRTFEALVFYG